MARPSNEPTEAGAIQAALRSLIGLPLRESNRIVDMQSFGFGNLVTTTADRTYGTKLPRRSHVPEFALHVQCRWRIVRDGSILVGAADVFWPPAGSGTPYREFDYDGVTSRRDELVDEFMAHGLEAHLVQDIRGSSTGDARVGFADGCLLELWPDHRSGSEAMGPTELWRFFRYHEEHLVVTAEGIE